jgi:hypothetical protein
MLGLFSAIPVQKELDHRAFTEKRTTTRVLVSLVGVVTFDAGREGPKMIEVMASDVSADGAYLWLVDPRSCPRVGAKIGMKLRCVSELERFQLSVNATGIVVRIDQPRKTKHGFAVQFEQLADSCDLAKDASHFSR